MRVKNKGKVAGGKKIIQDGTDDHLKVVLWTVADA
jgi:hypothetical protein